MPAPVYQNYTETTSGSATSRAVAVPAGAAAGDLMLVVAYMESTAAVTAPSGFTELPIVQVTGAEAHTLRRFWKRLTGADTGSYTFSWSGSTWAQYWCVRITGAITSGDPFDAVNSNVRASAGTTFPATSLTTTGPDRLLIHAGFSYALGTCTPSSGYTGIDLTDILLAHRTQAAAGSTGSVTGTGPSAGGYQTAWLGAIRPVPPEIDKAGSDTATVAVSDSAALLRIPVSQAGTDTAAIAITESTELAKEVAKTADDTVAVAVADSAYIGTPVDAAGTDTATIGVTETVVVSKPVEQPPVADSFAVTVSEAVEILASVPPLADSGDATDHLALTEWAVPLADSGTTSDAVTTGDQVVLAEHGEALDLVTILDIPFTQFLPLDTGPTYDLVVVARVPQASGPPTFLEVDPIEWQSLSYTNTLSKPQELTASCLIAGLTEPVLQRLRYPKDLPSELWLLRDGTRVFAGPLLGGQVSGETLTVQALGLLAYLRLMVIDQDTRFDQVDQFTMAKTMVDQWQALEFGDFGIDTSSVGVSGKLRDGTYLRAEKHNVGERVEDLGRRAGGFDVEVDPSTRRLQLWHPGKGVDRSSGEDAVVFDSRNITSGDLMFSVAVGDLASEAYGSGTSVGAADTLFSVRSNLELRAKFGRVAVTGTWSDVSEQSTLDDHTQGLLDARSDVLLVPGPKVRVTPDADLDAYGVGDTVAYELHSQLGVSGAFRIRSQRVTVAATGQESVDLEFV